MAEKIKAGLLGAALGAVVLAIIGFTWGGWVTAGTFKEEVSKAVLARLVRICVAQFNEDPQKEQDLAALKKKAYWDRDEFIKAQGWATMPGDAEPAEGVAESCAEKVV
ncbi:MAG: hypothetical protein HY724_12935 [Candidatus Rokubacteria bacterium]|nr:hypothetical protein [Candidatus Rokubacteria bacterium]